MASDGAIIISTEIDNKNAQRQLNQLERKIQALNDKAYVQGQQRMPLVEEAKRLGAALDAAKAKLAQMQSGQQFFTSDHIKEQTNAVNGMQKEWEYVQSKVERYDSAIQKTTLEIERNKTRAGELQLQLAKAGSESGRMPEAMERARKSAEKFSLRLKEVVRSALVFTIISQGLTLFRDWIGKVVKSNEEASAAIARLKGALLTLAQPMVDVVIPAFTAFLNILTAIISEIAKVFSLLFGTTADQSRKAAEELHAETAAIGSVGSAAAKASKQLASFDEINKLSNESAGGGSSGGAGNSIQPDFSALNNNWLSNMLGEAAGWVTAGLMLGGIALVAIGTAIGSLKTVIAGLVILGVGLSVGVESGVIQSWVDTLGLGSVAEFAVLAIMLGGIAIVAIGAAMGNVMMVISGLTLLGVSIFAAEKSGVMEDWAESLGLSRAAQFVTAALLLGGIALIAIGAITKNVLMVIAGLALLGAGIYVGTESDTFSAWAEVLGLDTVFGYVAAGLQLAGLALIAIGAAMGNIFMVVAGSVMLGSGIGMDIVGEETLSAWWEVLKLTSVQQWVSVALLLGGIVFVAIGAVMGNVLMVIAGLVMLGVGTVVAAENDNLKDWVAVLGLQKVAGWVTAALLLAGIGLVVFGIVSGNIFMLIAGLGLIGAGVAVGVTSGTFSSWIDTILKGLKSGWAAIKNWWSTNVAKFFTIDFWKNLGSNIVNGFMNGLKDIFSKLGGWASGVKDTITGTFNSGTATARSYSVASPSINKKRMPAISTADIPMLAQGAVIPPNRKFTAVLGDQTHGNNLEGPENLFRKIVREESGGSGEATALLQAILDAIREGKVLTVDKKVLARFAAQGINDLTRASGKPVLLI